MYSKITNPETGMKISLESRLGIETLRKYLLVLKGGATMKCPLEAPIFCGIRDFIDTGVKNLPSGAARGEGVEENDGSWGIGGGDRVRDAGARCAMEERDCIYNHELRSCIDHGSGDRCTDKLVGKKVITWMSKMLEFFTFTLTHYLESERGAAASKCSDGADVSPPGHLPAECLAEEAGGAAASKDASAGGVAEGSTRAAREGMSELLAKCAHRTANWENFLKNIVIKLRCVEASPVVRKVSRTEVRPNMLLPNFNPPVKEWTESIYDDLEFVKDQFIFTFWAIAEMDGKRGKLRTAISRLMNILIRIQYPEHGEWNSERLTFVPPYRGVDGKTHSMGYDQFKVWKTKGVFLLNEDAVSTSEEGGAAGTREEGGGAAGTSEEGKVPECTGHYHYHGRGVMHYSTSRIHVSADSMMDACDDSTSATPRIFIVRALFQLFQLLQEAIRFDRAVRHTPTPEQVIRSRAAKKERLLLATKNLKEMMTTAVAAKSIAAAESALLFSQQTTMKEAISELKKLQAKWADIHSEGQTITAKLRQQYATKVGRDLSHIFAKLIREFPQKGPNKSWRPPTKIAPVLEEIMSYLPKYPDPWNRILAGARAVQKKAKKADAAASATATATAAASPATHDGWDDPSAIDMGRVRAAGRDQMVVALVEGDTAAAAAEEEAAAAAAAKINAATAAAAAAKISEEETAAALGKIWDKSPPPAISAEDKKKAVNAMSFGDAPKKTKKKK